MFHKIDKLNAVSSEAMHDKIKRALASVRGLDRMFHPHIIRALDPILGDDRISASARDEPPAARLAAIEAAAANNLPKLAVLRQVRGEFHRLGISESDALDVHKLDRAMSAKGLDATKRIAIKSMAAHAGFIA